MIVLLPRPLGDACLALHEMEPAWPRITIARQFCSEMTRRVIDFLGIPVSDGDPTIRLTQDWGFCQTVSARSVAASDGVGHMWQRPPLGAGVALCPHASVPDKEWAHWDEVADLGEMVPRTHHDLLGAILAAHTVVANHSGPAHFGALLGRQVVCLQHEPHPVDPIGALMLGPGWPSVADVRACIASLAPAHCKPLRLS